MRRAAWAQLTIDGGMPYRLDHAVGAAAAFEPDLQIGPTLLGAHTMCELWFDDVTAAVP